MASSVALTLDQANDETLSGTVAQGAAPFALTGATIEMYIKAGASTPDTDASVTKLSTATGEIVVTSAAGGTYSVTVPASVVATAGNRWYRVDTIISGARKTVVYGTLTVRDL